jgi:hypothetical protein
MRAPWDEARHYSGRCLTMRLKIVARGADKEDKAAT